MKWEMLTLILEKAVEKVNSLNDVDERMAMLVFYVAEMVEAEERAACAKLCVDTGKDMTIMAQWGAAECSTAIRARGQK
jgi:hypothetical protein